MLQGDCSVLDKGSLGQHKSFGTYYAQKPTLSAHTDISSKSSKFRPCLHLNILCMQAMKAVVSLFITQNVISTKISCTDSFIGMKRHVLVGAGVNEMGL